MLPDKTVSTIDRNEIILYTIRRTALQRIPETKEIRTMETKEQLLHTYFGYTAFRVGQDRLIDAVLAGRDAFASCRPAAGKVYAIRSLR